MRLFCGVSPRLLVLLLLSSAPVAAQTAGAPPPDRPAIGVYTDSQAVRGETVYSSVCASCHTTSFHTDEQFRFNWFGRTVYDLFKTLKTTMPEDNPGGLSDDDYTRVIAYILKLNGFQSGTDSLSSDTTAMKRIRIKQSVADTVKQHR